MRKESPSLTNQWDISSGQLWVRKTVVWKTAVLVSQISQTCWQAKLCSSEAVGPHLNSSVKKAGHWENDCVELVVRGYIVPLINMLTDLLSSYIYFQSLRDIGLKIIAVQVFKRYWGTCSLLEPERWGEHCKCVFLSSTMESKLLSVANISEFKR